MNVFYITNWPVYSGLSSATAWPNVRLLAQEETIDSVSYFTVESEGVGPINFDDKKVRHVPVAVSTKTNLLSRLKNERQKYRAVWQESKKVVPDVIICRGAPSGMIGKRLSRKLSVPFIVESFEPHADYMLHAGVWRRNGLKYAATKFIEKSTKRGAKYIITVSKRYREHLVENESLAESRVLNAPCAADYKKLHFSSDQRESVRRELSIEDRLSICYIGKFGGLYYDDIAFLCMKYVFDALDKNAFFIVLTESDPAYVKAKMRAVGISRESYFCKKLPHGQINRYLSASDFGLSFVKSTPMSFACSPIKHSEYWASGLPLIMPFGIGEESDWISRERVGVEADIGDPNDVRLAVQHIRGILSEVGHRARIREVARQRRPGDATADAYKAILREVRREAGF